jgi:hypothetical protein
LSNGSAYEDEMGLFSRLSDRELDRLFAGKGPAEDRELEELAGFFRELPVVFQQAPDASTEARHLTAIMEAVRLLPADEGTASLNAVEESKPGGRAAWLGRTSRAARFALAGVLVLGLFCGAAYAGALPGPVQGAVADVARNIGVSLPGAHNDKDNGAQNNKHDGAQNNSTPDTRTDTNEGAQNGQGTQSETNGGAQNGGNQGSQNRNQGAQSDRNPSGTNDAAGNGGQNNPDQGAHGNVGTAPHADQSGGNQDNGSQGNGGN